MLHAFLALTMDERWVKRTPEEMFHSFHGFHGEGFHLILEDLLDLPTRGARVGRGVQAVASPDLSIAESSRSGRVVDSYSRMEAYCFLPAWIVMEHSRTHKRPGNGPD